MINWLFISTGVFLGWSLGANHAVNVFGTAVASRMIRFRTAAIVAGIFVVLGAVLSGAGTTRTLNTLGAVNAIAGAFTVALAVGLTVAWMTKLKLPVSTSQAVVGGIIGWNMFTGSPTDTGSLSKILTTWVVGPILAAAVAFILLKIVAMVLRNMKFHMLHIDAHTRTGLMVGGATAAYVLGANNIANVMGMFVNASPFSDRTFFHVIHVSGTEQLFLIGGLAIAVGIYTYGERVMATVGKDLYKITPLSGLVVIMAETIILFLFTSEMLETALLRAGLPSFPLVPLSSTQVVIGAVIGVGLAKGGRGINYGVLLKIASGWVIAPVVAGIISFILLFFVQNVFEQKVVRPTPYTITDDVLVEIRRSGVDAAPLTPLRDTHYAATAAFRQAVEGRGTWTEQQLVIVFASARLDSLVVDTLLVERHISADLLTTAQRRALYSLHGRVFPHRWQFEQTLEVQDPSWLMPPGDERAGKRRVEQLGSLYDLFRKH